MKALSQLPQFDRIYKKYTKSEDGTQLYLPYNRIDRSVYYSLEGATKVVFKIKENLYGGNYTFNRNDKVVLPNPPMEISSTTGHIFSLTSQNEEDLNSRMSFEDMVDGPSSAPPSSPQPSGSKETSDTVGTTVNPEIDLTQGEHEQDLDALLSLEELDEALFPSTPRSSPQPSVSNEASNKAEKQRTLALPPQEAVIEPEIQEPVPAFEDDEREDIFLNTLERQFRRTPPLALFKYTSTKDPRYFLGTPEVLPNIGPAERDLKRNGQILCHLYRYRVSGKERAGIYTYVSTANQEPNQPTWLDCPSEVNGEWQLLETPLSRYVRLDSLEKLHKAVQKTSQKNIQKKNQR